MSMLLQKALDSFYYQTKKTEYINVWAHSNVSSSGPSTSSTPGTIEYTFDHGLLTEKNIDEYVLRRSQCAQRSNHVGGLQLIFCDIEADYNAQQVIPPQIIPIDKETFTKVVIALKLSYGYFVDLSVRGAVISSQFETLPRHDCNIGFWAALTANPYQSMVLSHETATGITSCLLSNAEPKMRQDFVRILSERPAYACHPLSIPMLVNEGQVDIVRIYLRTVMEAVMIVESETGQSPWLKKQPMDGQQLDLLKLCQQLNHASIHISARSPGLLHITQLLGDFQGLLQKLSRVGSTSGLQNDVFDNLAFELTQMADNQLHNLKYMGAFEKALQERIQTQFTFIYNMIAQRDSKLNYQIAAAAKQDSAAMKTIAILGVVFLPATFISGFFAMPLFDWQAPDGKSIVQVRIWIYFVVTVLLTLSVVLLWRVLLSNQLLRMRREENAAPQDHPSTTQTTTVPAQALTGADEKGLKNFVGRARHTLPLGAKQTVTSLVPLPQTQTV